MKPTRMFLALVSLALAIIIIGVAPASATPNPTDAVLYSPGGGSSLLSNYITASMPMTDIAHPTGMNSFRIVLASSDGSRLFASGPDSNNAANAVIVELDRTPGGGVTAQSVIAMSVAGRLSSISPNGTRLYFQKTTNDIYIVDVNSGPSTLSVEANTIGSVGGSIVGTAVSLDNSQLYVLVATGNWSTASVKRYNTSTRAQIGSSISVGSQQAFSAGGIAPGFAVGPDGRVWVANGGDSTSQTGANAGHTLTVFNADGSGVNTVDLGPTSGASVPNGLVFNGNYLYVANYWGSGGVVSVVDTSLVPTDGSTVPSNAVLTPINLGLNPANNIHLKALAISPDGSYIYIGQNPSFPVPIIKTSNNSVEPTSAWLSYTLNGIFMTAASFPANLGIGDDYPGYSNPDPWGFVPSNCTSFAAWRWHRDGHDVTWSGDAGDWDNHATGKTVNNTPAVGSIAVWESGQSMLYSDGSSAGNAGGTGHVAYVTSVEANGTYWIEQYNWGSPTLTYKGPWHLKVTTSGGVTWPKFIHQ